MLMVGEVLGTNTAQEDTTLHWNITVHCLLFRLESVTCTTVTRLLHQSIKQDYDGINLEELFFKNNLKIASQFSIICLIKIE